MEAQIVDDYEETAPDSDDEVICRPVMLNVKKVVSAKPDKVVGGSLPHNKDSLLGAVDSAFKRFHSVYTGWKMKPACAQPVSGPGVNRHNITDDKNSCGNGSINAEADSHKQLGIEDNGSCNLYKTEKDCTRFGAEYETGKLSYTESQGLGEPSEADALEFVDRFISSNNLILSEKVTLTKTTNRDNSPPASCGKAIQSLAKRASLGTTIGMSGIFEWNDHQICDEEGTEPRCINMSRSSRKPNVQGHRNLKSHNAKDVGEAVQLSETKSDKEKRDQLHGESPDQQPQNDNLELDVQCTFDVGFDTQMAAEAMESLFYAPVTNSMMDYAHQDADKKVEEDSSEGLPQKCASPTSNQFGFGAITRSLNPSKKSAPNFSKSYRKEAKSKRELNPGLPNTRKLKKVKSLPEKNPLDPQNPTIARRSRRLSTVYQSKGCTDIRHVKEVSVQKKRKRTTEHVDCFEALNPGELHKTNSPNIKVSRRDQEDVTAQSRNFLDVGIWNFPKGKRKPRGSKCNLNGESHSCTPVKIGNDHKHPAEEKSNSERNCGKSSFITYVKRKPRSLAYTQHVGSSLVKKCENNLLDRKSDERVLDGRTAIHKGSRIPLLKELISLGVSGPVLSSAPKDVRRRREMANVRVMFSNNLDRDIIKQQKKILARLGSSVASNCSEATHFVADRFLRTRNMLEAMALGKPVVTHLWLDSCGQARCYLDEKNYVLRDDIKEREIGFSMHRSLAHARENPLMKGRTVLATPKAKPSSELISSLVKVEQGQVVKKSTVENNLIQGDDLLILSCDEDYAECVSFLEKGAEIYSSELLLNGIIIRKLEFERHRLFVNYQRVSCC